MPAGKIAEQFDVSRPAISRHLRVLRECGVIEATVSGRERVYALRPEPLAEVAAYLARLIGPVSPHTFDALATEVARTAHERRTTRPLDSTHVTRKEKSA